VKVTGTGGDELIDISLDPVEKPSHLSHLVIVSLKPSTAFTMEKLPQKKTDGRDTTGDRDDYIRQMEQELQETREYLNNVIEELETSNQELRSANEEAQSTNEEMQSTNEELETSKEEMQSLNEELETSNNELHRKIEEVSSINNDLNNFLKSTEIGILFLDKHLRIRRFSPQIKELISLQESDIGRSIQDFGINFIQEDLASDVRTVLDRLRTVEKEISTGRDRQYWMRISPYRTSDDRIEGVVITFTDITERNRAEKLEAEAGRLRKYMHMFHQMQHGFALYRAEKNNSDAPGDLKLVEANKAFGEMVQITPGKNLDKLIQRLFGQKDHDPEFLEKSAHGPGMSEGSILGGVGPVS
jgi:two-component system, chemotaxis family, CheB/CheR fusion protein